MSVAASIVEYLKRNRMSITTAESCTAGKIITLLSEVDGGGSCIESGYVVYSPEAKQRLLNVRAYTIDTFNLTSCEVAREMVLGALDESPAGLSRSQTWLCACCAGFVNRGAAQATGMVVTGRASSSVRKMRVNSPTRVAWRK